MNDRPSQRQAPPPAPAGLCGRCLHVQPVQSSRGSTFYLCRLSFSDPRFARYPPLPVLSCAGFVPREQKSERTP
jgi:hypothetical protein